MDSDLINKETFIDPATEQGFLDLASTAEAAFNQIEARVNEYYSNVGEKLKGIPIPETTKQFTNLNNTVKGATSITKEYAQVLYDTKQANKDVTDSIKAGQSAYAAANIEAQKLAQTYKDLAISEGISSKAALEAKAAYLEQAAVLKTVDQSMGNYSRNVGNYGNSIMGSVKKLSEGSHVLKALGAAFGLHIEGIREYTMGIRGLTEIMIDSTEATNANTEATEASTVAAEEKTVANEAEAASNEEVGMSTLATLGVIGLVVAAVAAAAYGIYELVEARKADKEAAESQKEAAKLYNEALKTTIELEEKLSVLKKDKSQGDVDLENKQQQAYELNLKATQARDLALKALGDPVENPGDFKGGGMSGGSVYAAALSAYQEYTYKKKNIDDEYNKQTELAQKLADTAQDVKDQKQENDFNKKKEELENEIKLLQAHGDKKKELQVKESDEIQKINESDEYSEEQKLALIFDIREKYAIEFKNLQEDEDNKAMEKLKEQTDKELKQIEETYAKEVAAMKKKFDDEQKLSDEFYKDLNSKQEAMPLEAARNKLEADKNKIKGKGTHKQRLGILADEIDVTQKEFDEKESKLEDWKQKEQEKINKANPLAGSKLTGDKNNDSEIERQTNQAIDMKKALDETVKNQALLDEQKLGEDKKALKKKFNEEELGEVKANSKKALAILDKQLKDYNDKLEKNLEAKNKIIQEDKDAQDAANNAGKANNLDSVLKQQAANLTTAQAQQRTAANEYDYISILSQILSGAPTFYEGTDNTGIGGSLDSKGGFLSVLHPEERVFTADQNAKLGNVSNDALVDAYMLLPQLNLNDVSKSSQYKDAGFIILANKLDQLIAKKDVEYVYETDREAVRIVTENGVKRTVVTYKSQGIKYQKHPAA